MSDDPWGAAPLPEGQCLAVNIWSGGEGRVLIDTTLFVGLDWDEQARCVRDWVECLEGMLEDVNMQRLLNNERERQRRPALSVVPTGDDEPP